MKYINPQFQVSQQNPNKIKRNSHLLDHKVTKDKIKMIKAG